MIIQRRTNLELAPHGRFRCEAPRPKKSVEEEWVRGWPKNWPFSRSPVDSLALQRVAKDVFPGGELTPCRLDGMRHDKTVKAILFFLSS